LIGLRQTVTTMLGLDVDVSDFFSLVQDDPDLAAVGRAVHGLKPPRFPSPTETFAERRDLSANQPGGCPGHLGPA
jgi:hypothetical protein